MCFKFIHFINISKRDFFSKGYYYLRIGSTYIILSKCEYNHRDLNSEISCGRRQVYPVNLWLLLIDKIYSISALNNWLYHNDIILIIPLLIYIYILNLMVEIYQMISIKVSSFTIHANFYGLNFCYFFTS
jgi:hypothetical protein